MSSSSIKTVLTLVSLSGFGLLGCAGNEVATEAEQTPSEVSTQKKDAAEKSSTESVLVVDTQKADASTGGAAPKAENEGSSAVETMPASDVGSASIAVETMPAAEAQAEPATVVVEEVVEEKAAPADTAAAVDMSKLGPNEHVIRLVKKDPSHPAYGKGHAMGFSVDGVQGKSIVLERGKTYTFDIDTDPKHDVYISGKEIGWGSASIVEGVDGAYIYKGKMTFTPGKNTPDKVYYACRNHPYMGATLYIVDPGETVDIQAHTPAAAAVPKKSPAVSESKVKQKLMFADMMINGQGAKRVMASSNTEAKKLLASAKSGIAASREKMLAGDLSAALALADRALKDMGAASRLVPSEDAKAQLSRRYDELQQEIKDFELSYERNYELMAKAGSVPDEAKYDKQKVSALKSEASLLAGKGDYAKANAKLEEAQGLVTMGLHKMLDSKTLVYDLKFDSPAQEFDYELKRFAGYEELIPVAIEMKKPAAGALQLMDSFLDKARKRRDEAQQKADAGDYGAAIEMMKQATKTVRRALRMVGVTQ